MQLALNYIKNNKTVLEVNHPYVAQNQQCPNISDSFKIENWHNLSSMDMLEFLKALKDRPVTVAYHASNHSFGYAGGVIALNDTEFCPAAGGVNHGVVAVGYSINSSEGSWIKFKNSWGQNWGENGYFRM